MIGVAVHPTEQTVVTEFFELFKTPWEFYRNNGSYDVLICTGSQVPPNAARLVLHYRAEATEPDAAGLSVKSQGGGAIMVYESRSIPIYGEVATFPGSRVVSLIEEGSGESAACLIQSGSNPILRVGYNLFAEMRYLLEVGQPAVNAGTATLELHIALLRELITSFGIPIVEIPPSPQGRNFITCLTHDIDHPVLRNHCCDHTMVGFLYRATIGTVVNVCNRRKSLKDLCINWTAALKLPFIYLGMAKDFWSEFDRYVEIEAGLASTYFVIPTKNYPGRPLAGNGISRRATRYDVNDVKPQLQRVVSSGCEVGLHGIDTWADSAKGREERARVTESLGASITGVRMHWLFFNEKSPEVLERAGFAYDSTVGYGETVGYRAGTTQAYKPLTVGNLLELPLHVMDTALFYPNYLNLSEADAKRTVWKLIDNAAEFGGALTINWHDRSIAPERLWDGFYLKLLRELKGRGAWFASADQAVSWFRKRRSAVVETMPGEGGNIRIKASVKPDHKLPGLRVRLHKPAMANGRGAMSTRLASGFVDLNLDDQIDTEIRL
ncbi:MAG TPA: hypothetical protein VMA35_10175 [Candidatus Sulfopaludibacter sp.]|nr:hypothetical protein [Candidatus Sulfopaludibacter sp.]